MGNTENVVAQGKLFPMADSFNYPSTPHKAPYEDPTLLQEVFKKAGRRTVLLVSQDAVIHNIKRLQDMAGSATGIMAVVKGAAYGSGIMGVATAALEGGAKELAVAAVSEGIYLRKQGITVPITVLGNLNTEEVSDVLAYCLHPTVSWSKCIDKLKGDNLVYQDGSPLEVHIEIDTGMSRFGIQPSELAQTVETIRSAGVKIRSLYTHFQSPITSPEKNSKQLQMFMDAAQQFPDIPLHAAATTGCVQGYGTELTFIRPGGAVTGLCSGSSEEDTEAFAKCNFQPAFSVVAKPSFYKLLKSGHHVGYDQTYTTKEDQWIANFNTGWSDGLARKLTNTGFVKRLKTGEMCPIVGRVSMDSITVRLPECPEDDESFAIITADYHPLTSAVGIARTLGGATYEVPGNWSTRIPMVHVRDGLVTRIQPSLEYTN